MKDISTTKFVCLGGGIGTVNLIKGLRDHTKFITVVVSVADDGGSAGRIRRLYNIPPPGDIISCLAALSQNQNPLVSKLLTYRFPGDRYGRDDALPGHKLGNLLLAATAQLTGDFQEAVEALKELFDIPYTVLASTLEQITLRAVTVDGIHVEREENIDLGKYSGKRILEKVSLIPENPAPTKGVIEAIMNADVIIAGPGDLYTTILPVLIIPGIKEAVLKSKAKRLFVVNVANKPFETKGYKVSQFIRAVENHIGTFPFEKVFVNNNFSCAIPDIYHYTYVQNDSKEVKDRKYEIIDADLVDESFPLYHDNQKLARLVVKSI